MDTMSFRLWWGKSEKESLQPEAKINVFDRDSGRALKMDGGKIHDTFNPGLDEQVCNVLGTILRNRKDR